MATEQITKIDDIVVRFAGDSGDGMQLSGTLFSDASALTGNDIATFPDYPAEIRAPHNTIAGVSGYQVHVGNHITKQYHNHKLASVWQGYITGSKESQDRIKEQQTYSHTRETYYKVQRNGVTKQILRHLIVSLT